MMRTRSPLYVVSLWYEGQHARGRLEGPLPLPAEGPLDARIRVLTQEIADRLARGIAEHPQDWHMLQRLWLREESTEDAAVPSVGATAVAPQTVRPFSATDVLADSAAPVSPEGAPGDPVVSESG